MSNQHLVNAANDLFKAIDIITEKQVNEMKFDKTLICTITGDGSAKQGVYTVSDGSSEFIAYSEDTTYKVNTKVYVKVPNGDMVNQKIITGKYIANNEEYIPYVAPLDAFIDITGNLIEEEYSVSLRANDKSKSNILVWDYSSGHSLEAKNRLLVLIEQTKQSLQTEVNRILNNTALTPDEKQEQIDNTTRDFEDIITFYENQLSHIRTFKGFERIGLKADFKTLIKSNVYKGSYGLRLDVTEITQTGLTKVHSFYLDSSDMYGNPYKFSSYFSQEILFDISHLYDIIEMKLYFYQMNNFLLYSGEEMPVDILYDDLMAQSFYISFGYATESFTEEKVLLESYDSMTYSTQNKDPKRRINLRWIHKMADKFYAIDEDEEMPQNAVIHWYRYNLAQNVHDELAGYFWEEFYPDLKKFSYIFTPDYTKDTDKFKVIIEFPSRQSISDLLDSDPNIISALMTEYRNERIFNDVQIEDIKAKLCLETDAQVVSQNYSNLRNIYRDSEQRLAVLGDVYEIVLKARGTIQFYESEELKFENEISQQNELFDLIKSFSLEVDKDGFNGVYRLYDSNNSIINSMEASKMRTIKANYTSVATAEQDLNSAEEITWYFPAKNTMIVLPVEGKEYNLANGDLYFSEEECDKFGYVAIRRFGVDTNDEIESGLKLIEATQTFRIKDYFDQSAVNNTIYCTVKKRERLYGAVETLYFGPASSSNTQATFRLNLYSVDQNNTPIDRISAITLGEKAIIVPELYNYNNVLVDISNATINYKWETDTDLVFSSANRIISAEGITAITKNVSFSVLKATIGFINTGIMPGAPNDADISLTAYLPIAVRKNKRYSYLEGTTQIVYNEQGYNPDYYKEPYNLFNEKEEKLSLEWFGCAEEFLEATQKELEKLYKFYPRINTEGFMLPSSMYYSGLSIFSIFAVNKYDSGKTYEELISDSLFVQPIIISQAKPWLPSILQNWDGSLTIDEKNGTILSTMIGAGIKNSDKSFSGVLMGDVSKAENATDESVGLYGYYHGEQSFGFKVNGTAFIGIGGTKITFNGEKGLITGNHIEGNYISAGTIKGTEITNGDTFSVTADGILSCTNADVAGKITTDSIAVTGGDISLGGGVFHVDPKGNMFCSSADIEGNVNIVSGSITLGDNFEVDEDGNMSCSSASITGGNLDINETFIVDEDGNMFCSSASITGGNLDINKAFVVDEKGNVTITSGSITLGEKFKVETSGAMTCGSVTLNGSLTVTEGGTITAGEEQFSVDATGHVTCKDIKITGGTIGENSAGIDIDPEGVLKCSGAEISGTVTITGGAITLGTGESVFFKVDKDGKMECAGATINGSLNVVGEGASIKAGKNFSVTNEGEVTCTKINITTASEDGKSSFGLVNGVLECKGANIEGKVKIIDGEIALGKIGADGEEDINFSVTSSGQMSCNNARISRASISNAKISGTCKVEGTLSGGTITGASISVSSYISCYGLKVNGTSYSMTTTTVYNQWWRPSRTSVITEVKTETIDINGTAVVKSVSTESKRLIDLMTLVKQQGTLTYLGAESNSNLGPETTTS